MDKAIKLGKINTAILTIQTANKALEKVGEPEVIQARRAMNEALYMLQQAMRKLNK